MALDSFTYIFALGTISSLVEAFNNGASTYLISLPLPRESVVHSPR